MTDGTTTAQATAGALQCEDVALHVDNFSGLFTTDELARIDDAMAVVDVALANLDLARNRRPFRLKLDRVVRVNSPVISRMRFELRTNSPELPVIDLGDQ
jgi:hypothetical protein